MRSRIPPKHMRKGKEKESRITSQVVPRSGNTQEQTSGIHGTSHEICLISKKPCEPGNPRIGCSKDRTMQRTLTCQCRWIRLRSSGRAATSCNERKAKKIKHQEAISKKGKITSKVLRTSGRFSVDLAAKRLLAIAKGEITILQRENAVTAMG